MDLSKYCEENEEYWNGIERVNAQDFIKYLNEKIDVDLYEVGKSKDELEVFNKLNIWLYNFYTEEFIEGLNYIDYDYEKYKKYLIYSFILTVTSGKTNIDLLYDVLISKSIIEKMVSYKNSMYKLITKDFGKIVFKKALDDDIVKDIEVQEYLSYLDNRIVDACHEVSFFLIKKFDKLKAVTGTCNKWFDTKYYHSFILNVNNDVIDLAANLIMPKNSYYLLQEVEELNVINYNEYLSQKDKPKKFDKSKKLYELLRNALYNQYMRDIKDEKNHVMRTGGK